MPNFPPLEQALCSRRSFIKGLTVNAVLAKSSRPSPLADAPAPRYWFGDRVVYRFWADLDSKPGYEQEIVIAGTVVGLARGADFYFGNHFHVDWWYWIIFDGDEKYQLLECQHCESDLEPL